MLRVKINYRMRVLTSVVCLLTLLFIGCKEKYETPEAIAKIPIALEVKRFDLDFKNLKSDDFTQLKEEYPFLIPQNSVILNDTIRYNLDPFDEYDDDELYKALCNVNLFDKINKLPLKLNTVISKNNGFSFSYGEIQLFTRYQNIIN